MPGSPGRRRALLAAAMILSALLYVAILVFRLPWVHAMEGWFWGFRKTPLHHHALLVLLLLASTLVLHRSFGRRSATARNLIILVCLGFVAQISFALMEGRGLQALQDRMILTGHSRFARTALRHDSLLKVARNYETIVEREKTNPYLRTKPPGQFLTYMLTLKASRVLDLLGPPLDPLDRLTIFASLVWPLMTYAACLLLPPLDRLLCGGSSGLHAAVLFAVVPSVTLMTLHLDQCLYPSLALVSVILFVRAAYTGTRTAALLAGAGFYACFYFSFSLLPILALLLAYSALCPAGGGAAAGGTVRAGGDGVAGAAGAALGGRLLRIARAAGTKIGIWGYFAFGFAGADLAARIFLDYDLIRRFAQAILDHRLWKKVAWTQANVLRYGVLDLVEFSFWVGLPVMVLFAARVSRALVRAGRRRIRRGDAFALALAATLLGLAFFGKTAAESGRLWLFLVPFICASAASEILAAGRTRARKALLLAVVLQLAMIYVTKGYQDFW